MQWHIATSEENSQETSYLSGNHQKLDGNQAFLRSELYQADVFLFCFLLCCIIMAMI